MPSKNVRGTGNERIAARSLNRLFFECPLAPVEPAIGSQVGPVHVVAAMMQGLAVMPYFSLVSLAIPIRVGQLPDVRWCADVERPVVPQRSFRKHHPVGKHDALVKPSISIRVFQPHNAVRPRLQLNLRKVVRAAGVGDIQPALLVEISTDRTINERRSGDALDFHVVRKCKANGFCTVGLNDVPTVSLAPRRSGAAEGSGRQRLDFDVAKKHLGLLRLKQDPTRGQRNPFVVLMLLQLRKAVDDMTVDDVHSIIAAHHHDFHGVPSV